MASAQTEKLSLGEIVIDTLTRSLTNFWYPPVQIGTKVFDELRKTRSESADGRIRGVPRAEILAAIKSNKILKFMAYINFLEGRYLGLPAEFHGRDPLSNMFCMQPQGEYYKIQFELRDDNLYDVIKYQYYDAGEF
jgi:hypothetical protein